MGGGGLSSDKRRGNIEILFVKLLMLTIEVRTHVKLKELGMSMQRYVDGKCKYELLSV